MKRERESPGLLAHLEELRRRILAVIGFWALASGAAWFLRDKIAAFLFRPLLDRRATPVFLSPMEPLAILMKVSIFAGAIICLPFAVFQAWRFISPALTPQERPIVRLISTLFPPLFVLGSGFSFYIIMPFTLKILLSFAGSLMEPMITADRFLSFVLLLSAALGVLFNLPLVLSGLVAAQVLKIETLRKSRRLAFLLSFLVAAILTPTTDVITQTLLALPLIILYEISTILATVFISKSSLKKTCIE